VSVRQLSVRYELLQRIGGEHLFATNREALEAYGRRDG
jgi:hypothetical protein